jgi:hypothetical protein
MSDHPHPEPEGGPEQEAIEGQVAEREQEPDDHEVVRMWSTTRLQAMIGDLEPYTNGTLGEISPRHAGIRVQAIRELNRIWQAHIFPEPEPEGEDVEALRLEWEAEAQAAIEEAMEQARQEALEEAERERLALEEAEKEKLALEAAEVAERTRERVLSGIEELRRRAPGTGS